MTGGDKKSIQLTRYERKPITKEVGTIEVQRMIQIGLSSFTDGEEDKEKDKEEEEDKEEDEELDGEEAQLTARVRVMKIK